MSDFICKWWPTLTFLTGTLLGPLLYHLWFGNRKKQQEEELQALRNRKNEVEKELSIQNQISAELAFAQNEIQKNRLEYAQLHQELDETKSHLYKMEMEAKPGKTFKSDDLNLKNVELRKKIKKLQKRKESKKSNTEKGNSEFQVFISELDKLISKLREEPSSQKKKGKKSKKKRRKEEEQRKSQAKKAKKKKKEDKFAFYKGKFKKSSENLDKESLLSALMQEEERDLTYLYGITPEIVKVLYKEGITSFSDLSNTKIAKLREILAQNGDQFGHINPLNWPIQARIAEKGQWEILDEYKSKMNDTLRP